jgi:hypothetical protein
MNLQYIAFFMNRNSSVGNGRSCRPHCMYSMPGWSDGIFMRYLHKVHTMTKIRAYLGSGQIYVCILDQAKLRVCVSDQAKLRVFLGSGHICVCIFDQAKLRVCVFDQAKLRVYLGSGQSTCVLDQAKLHVHLGSGQTTCMSSIRPKYACIFDQALWYELNSAYSE